MYPGLRSHADGRTCRALGMEMDRRGAYNILRLTPYLLTCLARVRPHIVFNCIVDQ